MLVVGCGKLGGSFARAWRERHPADPPVCTVRNAESRARMPGFDIRVLDLLDRAATRSIVEGHDRVLVSVVGQEAWSTGVANLAAALPARAHVVHISSTGVYPEDGGGAVDENAPLDPGSALVAAEEALTGTRSTVLRCSGLVGEGRGPQRMLARIAGSSRPEGWVNLVWVDDVVAAVVEAFEAGIEGTFNVSGSALLRSAFYDPLLARASLAPVDWTPGPSGKRVVADRFSATFATRLRPVDPAAMNLE